MNRRFQAWGECIIGAVCVAVLFWAAYLLQPAFENNVEQVVRKIEPTPYRVPPTTSGCILYKAVVLWVSNGATASTDIPMRTEIPCNWDEKIPKDWVRLPMEDVK